MKDIFNKRQRFSIRKFSVGVASVLIGIALFTPSQGVLASTENNVATEIGANSEKENATPTVEKKEENQNSPENQGAISNPAPKDTPIGSTRTTELETSGNKENNSLTTGAFVAGEDRSSTSAVRAASNPSEIKKYELTKEDAKKIKAGVIGSEGNKLDSLLLNGPELSPEAYTDDDFLKDKEELYIYEKGGKKYVGYNSHPLLEDTDGDGIIDSKEKPDEKLKWNVSERDMIMFMELSYRDDNYIDRVLNHKKPLTESELYKKNDDSRPRYEYMMMNKELGPYWERKKSYHTSSGLDAVLYETKSDFSYLPNGTAQVLAFRGTSDAKDIGTDITLGLGSNPQQGIDAENIMRELAKDKSITNLYLTGHSLGGYLVQRAMVEAYQLAYSDSRVMSSKEQRAYRNFYNNVLKKGTTFNAPKVRTSYFSSSEFWQKGLDSKNIAKSGKMTHYIVNNDSTIGKSVSNDSDVVINVGNTKGGHSSRSYFEADMINRRSEFMSGKRISLDGTGYQDKKIATVKSVEKVGETVVYSKRGDDIIKSTTVSIKDPDTGQITKNTLDEVFKKDGAKSTVVVTSLEPIVRYEKDATRPKGGANVTTAGTQGTSTVTTTYTVNSANGSLIPHKEPAVVVSSRDTVIKVPAKDEVAYLKEGDDVVKKTTSYQVNASTGALTPTEKKEIFKQNGAKAKVVVTPLQPSVRYEKDATRAKGGKNVTTAGTSGTRTVTTTYTVNPADGSLIPHEGKPVIKQSTPTVVKVPAKDEIEYLKDGDDVVKKTTTYAVNASTGALTPTVRKDVANPKGAKSKIVVTPLKPNVRYEKDATRAKGEAKITVAGTSGTRTVTTTYTVNPTDGSLIPHEGKPVIKQSTPTVVKVPAKDEIEYLKEGDNVVKKTTTYAVNASTGALTPTVRKDVANPKGAKSKVVVTPLEPIVRYEKDAKRVKGGAQVTVAGTPGTSTVTTTYTVNPTDGSLVPHEEPAVVVSSKPTVVKVPAQDEIEYLKEGDNVVKKTTTYEVNESTGILTPTEKKEIFKQNGAKAKVVVTSLEPSVHYEKDATRARGGESVTIAGTPGTRTVTTTYTVNPTDGSLIPHEGKPVIKPSTPTVIKVPSKDEVEYLKEGDDIVKKTTSYQVNASTGVLTSIEKKEVFKQAGAKSKVIVTPLEPSVRYEKDATRAKGEANVTTAGTPGTSTVTTTYAVNPTDGSLVPHEESAVVVPSKPTVVKVPAKDEVEYLKDGDDVVKKTTTYEVNASTGALIPTVRKDIASPNGTKATVMVTPLEPSIRYEKDATRAKGEANVTTAGTSGTRTVTTTYTVNPTDGSLIPHEGKPVIKSSTPTVVKVPAKDEVEYLKDGDDVVKKTTTYAVNASTGGLTPTEKKEVFKKDGAKAKVVVTPIEPSVRYEKDSTKAKGGAKVTVSGTQGTRTVTTTYAVNPTDGSLVPHEEPAVVIPSTPTVVKVPAKDEVEYLKDGDNVVKKTTTYEVNPNTGALTPTVREDITSPNGTKATVVVTPLEPSIRYEKDAIRAKGGAKVTVAGTPGTRTVTTTYTVNPTDGSLIPHEGPAVEVPAKPTVIKVPVKDEVEYLKEGDDVVKKTTSYEVNASTGTLTPTEKKEVFKKDGAKSTVVVTPLEPSIRYEKDVTRAKGEANVTTDGTPGTRTVTTTYTVNSTDGSLIPHEGQPVIKPSTLTVVKVPAKDEVEYLKEGDDIVKKTTTYQVDPNTGVLTPTETTEIFKQNGAKSTVVVTPLEPSVRYEKDATRVKGEANVTVAGTSGTRTVTTTYTVNPTDGSLIPHEEPAVVVPAKPTVVKVPAKDKVVETSIEPEVEYVKDVEKDFGTPDQRTEGEKGKIVTTTTYDVDPKDGHITAHVGNPVVTPAGKKIVKVGAKTKVEQSKDPEGRDVIDTTTYEVDPKTGKVTPTTVRTYGTSKEPTTETRPVPSPVVYEKDDSRDKDSEPVRREGTPGEETITTTYTVDSKTGKITPVVGQPVRTKEPTNTIVKVAAKDKVVETSIEPEVEYIKDVEKDFGTPTQRTEGEKGKTVTTTTYDVDPKDGHITEHVGNPVVTPAGKTIVKVGVKTKVERNKDDQSRDVIDTITYEVDPKTGKVISTIVRTYGTTKEPTTETRPVPSPVVYEKDDSRDKDSEPVRREGTPGEETITTTYTVDSKTGKITPVVGQPVRTKEPTNTIVKVAAKDKVETIEIPSPKKYVKDDTRDKGQDNVEEAGQAGSRTTTTTYEVNPADGTITERVGEPVVVNPTATIVKVPAKDKVVETLIEPEVEYVKDVEKDFGTPDQRTEGEKGKIVTTTTYDVDPKDGHITAHVGNPVVTPAGKKIVKVGAKTKVEQSKDPEGRDVIDTITYEVDPKTGKVTPTTVRTYGTTKEPKVEVEQDPKTGDVTVTPKKPDGSTYPPETKVEIPGGVGKGKVPDSGLPDVEKPGIGETTEPGKPSVEVPNVTTPPKVTVENGELSEPITLPELTIEVRWIDESRNGLKSSVKTGNEKDAEHGSIPGYEFVRTVISENEPLITHMFRKVSGSTTPNPATPPNVTTPAKVIPETPETEKPVEIEITPQPNGDAIVTPKKPGGGTYPPGTKVEIPGEDGNTITVEIGKDGSGKVPNDKLPKKAVPGTGTVTEPNKKPSQPVNVTTPARKTPTIELKPDPKTGDVTVTPQRPGGGTYPPGTTVEIPGEDGPITVEIGKDGKGKVPNDKLPKKAVPGTGKITEPGKPAVEVPNVTTPAKVTPETPETEKPVEIEITPQPNGDAIVTPKKPGGGTYPPGTKVEIPGEDGNTITVEIGKDGSGKVPNDKLPKKAVPGTGKITEPGKPAVEVPNVTTPGKFTPETPVTEKPVAPVTPDTPVKPDTNGGSGQDTPAPTPATPTPNADQVDTKTTVDNGAKSNDSQNVLPNTGTESNATLASLGLLGMLGGLGLVARKKKED